MISNVEGVNSVNLTLVMNGDIDLNNVKEHQNVGYLAIEQYKPCKLVLDFDKVTFMDSSCVGFILCCYKRVKSYNANGEVIIKNSKSTIKKLLRIAGLDRIVTIE